MTVEEKNGELVCSVCHDKAPVGDKYFARLHENDCPFLWQAAPGPSCEECGTDECDWVAEGSQDKCCFCRGINPDVEEACDACTDEHNRQKKTGKGFFGWDAYATGDGLGRLLGQNLAKAGAITIMFGPLVYFLVKMKGGE